MFGWFKPKPAPEGPATLQAGVDVEVSADTLFGLVNFADPRCWKRDVGTVEAVAPGRFRMELDMLPGVTFTMVVSEAEPGRLYAFESQMTPRQGRLVHCHESYAITPTGAESCHVALETQVRFEDGLTRREWQREVEMMGRAVQMALAKLKVHAEFGVEPIREIEHYQKVA